jgi:hypothetical protein
MSKKTTLASKGESTQNVGAYTQLKAELANAQAVNAQQQQVINDAAAALFYAEERLILQVGRKPNWLNILFHFKEIVAVLQEVLRIIANFKTKYVKAPTPVTNDTPQ